MHYNAYPTKKSGAYVGIMAERLLSRGCSFDNRTRLAPSLGQDYMNRKAAWYVMGVCNWKSYYVKERGPVKICSFFFNQQRHDLPPCLSHPCSREFQHRSLFHLSPGCPEASGRADNRGFTCRARGITMDCWSNDNPEINATYIGRAIVDRNNDRGWSTALAERQVLCYRVPRYWSSYCLMNNSFLPRETVEYYSY